LYCVFSLFQILNAKLIVITQGVTCVSCISCKKMSSRFKCNIKEKKYQDICYYSFRVYFIRGERRFKNKIYVQ